MTREIVYDPERQRQISAAIRVLANPRSTVAEIIDANQELDDLGWDSERTFNAMEGWNREG